MMVKRASFEDQLDKNGFLIFVPSGKSMWPMLRNREDRFLFTRPQGKLSRNDIPIYRRQSDQHIVVHRIIRVRENDYVIRGDNTYRNEYGITDADIIGVMTGFIKGNKQYSMDDPGYLRYVRFWNAIYPLRWLYHATVYQIYRFGKKVRIKCGSLIAKGPDHE